MSKTKLAICTPLAWNAPVASFDKVEMFLKEIKDEAQKIPHVGEFVIVLSIFAGNPDLEKYKKLSKRMSKLKLASVSDTKLAKAYLYLAAFKKALQLDCDLIFEIDPTGAHDAKELGSFLTPILLHLRENPQALACTFGSRSAHGGDNRYPLYRTLVSKTGTILAKILLGLGAQRSKQSDLTSGYEAFSAPLLRKMFEFLPPEKWVSATWGPLHIFQTESRTFVCWISQYYRVKFFHQGIVFGAKFDQKPRKMKISFLVRAFLGLQLLILEQIKVKRALKKSVTNK